MLIYGQSVNMSSILSLVKATNADIFDTDVSYLNVNLGIDVSTR